MTFFLALFLGLLTVWMCTAFGWFAYEARHLRRGVSRMNLRTRLWRAATWWPFFLYSETWGRLRP